MGKITTDQSHQVVAALSTNVRWEEIDFETARLQDEIIRDPKGAGERFTTFLKNGGRMIIGESKVLTLNLASIFNPAKFINDGWSVWKGPANGNGLFGDEDKDERSAQLTSVDFGKVQFLTCLKKGETSITGEEKLKRLKAGGHIRLDGNVFLALWRDYEVNGENSILEWLRKNRDITYLDFFGEILRASDGSRCVLYLHWRGDEWYWHDGWLGSGWSDDGFSVVLPAS